MLLSEIDSDELFRFVRGTKLGQGRYRTVYAFTPDQSLVLKHDNMDNYSNISEMDVWEAARGTKWERWLAPCLWISGLGIWMLQKRTTPIEKTQLPKKVPGFLADLKDDNWGVLNGRVVCHDYGNHRALKMALEVSTLQPAKWR